MSLVNIRSGLRITSRKPREQHGDYALRIAIQYSNWYFRNAVSANGDFLAEGRDGELRLFQLSESFAGK